MAKRFGRSPAKIRQDGIKLRNIVGRSLGGTLTDYRPQQTSKSLRRSGIRPGFQESK